MASGAVKLNKMKRNESNKSHSWWWDSHISPKNSKWLQENLEEMDQLVKKMLKVIEEDADSFAKKAELYFKKRPELLSLVEEFYRMYRSLAERYDNVTGELRRSVPSDLQSQGSGISDTGSEPLLDHPKPPRTKSGPRAAGFGFFLGGSGSDLNSKEGDETSTVDSEAESDDSSMNYSGSQSNEEEQGLRKRVLELENELREMKGKFQLQKEVNSADLKESSTYQEEKEAAKEKIRLSYEEITRLTTELQHYKSLVDSHSEIVVKQNASNVSETNEGFVEIQPGSSVSEEETSDSSLKIQTLQEELGVIQKRFHDSVVEVSSLRSELANKGSDVEKSQNQIKSAQGEVSVLKNKLTREEREVKKLQDRILRYKSNLSERDQEIRGLKEAMSNANKALSEENDQLRVEITRMTKERTYLEDNLKEIDLRCQSSEEDLRRAKADIAVKDESLDVLNLEIENLTSVRDDLEARVTAFAAKISSKDHEMDEMKKHLFQLHLQHAELIAGVEEARKSADELQTRVKELEGEVERKHETIKERGEEKREAIRQLCFSLEHYRNGYYQLRQSIVAHKRPVGIAR